MNFKTFTLAALLVLPVTANAQVSYEMNNLAPGQVLMNLDATERTEVAQDTLVARLEYVVEGTDRSEVQNNINSKMKQVIAAADQKDSVQFSTENYHVYMMHEPRPTDSVQSEKISKWRGQQHVMLKSKNSDDVLDLAGQLQGMEMTMVNLSYVLSSEKYEEVSDGLMDAALTKLQARADSAAESLGKSSADLIRVDLGSSGSINQPQPMMMSMARGESAMSVEAPSARPRMSEVTMSVSATALLKP